MLIFHFGRVSIFPGRIYLGLAGVGIKANGGAHARGGGSIAIPVTNGKL